MRARCWRAGPPLRPQKRRRARATRACRAPRASLRPSPSCCPLVSSAGLACMEGLRYRDCDAVKTILTGVNVAICRLLLQFAMLTHRHGTAQGLADAACMTGQPTPDFFGGLKRLARATALRHSSKTRPIELAADSGSLASPVDSAESSAGSSSRGSSGGRAQLLGQHASAKENAQPWR